MIYISLTDKDKSSQLVIDGPLYLLSDLVRIAIQESSLIEIPENHKLEGSKDVDTNIQIKSAQNESPPGQEVGTSNSSQSLDKKGTNDG